VKFLKTPNGEEVVLGNDVAFCEAFSTSAEEGGISNVPYCFPVLSLLVGVVRSHLSEATV
jgi:hypothetical protein